MKDLRNNIFFKDQLLRFLEHTQDYEVAVSGATREKGLKPPKPSYLDNLTPKYERLNVF